MDIREALLELVNSESVRYSYMAIEKIIIVMMRDYLKAQISDFWQKMKLCIESQI